MNFVHPDEIRLSPPCTVPCARSMQHFCTVMAESTKREPTWRGIMFNCPYSLIVVWCFGKSFVNTITDRSISKRNSFELYVSRTCALWGPVRGNAFEFSFQVVCLNTFTCTSSFLWRFVFMCGIHIHLHHIFIR